MEEIDLAKILKDCPIGTKLYSPICGECCLMSVGPRNEPFPISVETVTGIFSFADDGRLYYEENGECLLFPSKNQRDWSKFEPPEEKFDPRTFNPFDMVLVMCDDRYWVADIVSHVEEDWVRCIGSGYVNKVIPYNESTKHLIGTSLACPPCYKWWKEILK